MKNCWKDKKVNFLIIFLLGIILVNAGFIPFVESNPNFNSGLEKGTQILKISHYNEQAWKNVVSTSIQPNNWLGGEANKLGAKYKSTIYYWKNSTVRSNTIFNNFVFTDEVLLLYSNFSDFDYGYIYISLNYPREYSVWRIGSHNWNFNTSQFNIFQESSDLSEYIQFIIQNPQDFNNILIDYNDYASKVNNDTTLQSLGTSFPIMDGDDLVWQFIIQKFALATPINEYLITMTKALDCKNTTVRGNTLIYKKHGIQDYTVEVTYNKYGTVDNFVLKNSDNDIIFKFTSFYPVNRFYLISALSGVCMLGIITFALYKKRRRFKIHNVLLERLKSKNG